MGGARIVGNSEGPGRLPTSAAEDAGKHPPTAGAERLDNEKILSMAKIKLAEERARRRDADGEVEGAGARGFGGERRATRIFRAMAAAVCAQGSGGSGGHGLRRGAPSARRRRRASRGLAAPAPRAVRRRRSVLPRGLRVVFGARRRRDGAGLRDEHGWVEGVRSALAAAARTDRAGARPGAAVDRLRARRRSARAAQPRRGDHDAGRVRRSRAAESGVAPSLSAITAEGVAGALLAVLQTRLLASKPEPPSELRGELMSLILLPYLGSAAARRELARPAASSAVGGDHRAAGARRWRAWARGSPTAGPRAEAIAERPGSSNREVANRAEVVDQGQISKLLSRLESQGLIVNVGGGGLRGAPNAWELTLRGEQIQHTIVRMAATSSTRGAVGAGSEPRHVELAPRAWPTRAGTSSARAAPCAGASVSR